MERGWRGDGEEMGCGKLSERRNGWGSVEWNI